MTKWNELTSDAVIQARAKAKRDTGATSYTLADGRGLMLAVVEKVKGQRTFTWRFQYRRPTTGKTNNLTFGAYFAGNGGVTIAQAREMAQEARETLAQGIDPADERNAAREVAKAAAQAVEEAKETRLAGGAIKGSFRAEAESFIEYKRKLVAKNTVDGFERNLRLYVYPVIGDLPLTEVKKSHVAQITEGLMTAGKLTTLDYVVNLGIAIYERAEEFDRCDYIPFKRVSSEIQKKIKNKRVSRHAAVDPETFGEVVRKINKLKRSATAVDALNLTKYTMQRSDSIRHMRWADIDFDSCLWTVPVEYQKLTRDQKENPNTIAHTVPLPTQAIAILRRRLEETARLESPWVFPNRDDKSRPIAKGCASGALRRSGLNKIQHAHGFRASGRTLGQYYAQLDGLLLETQLAHKHVGGAVKIEMPDGGMREVYLRKDEFLRSDAQQRARAIMVQAYADYVDELEHPKPKLALAA